MWRHRKIKRAEAETLLNWKEDEILQNLSQARKQQIQRLKGRENTSPRELGTHRILSSTKHESFVQVQEARDKIREGT